VLRHAIASLTRSPVPQGPKVLLTTVPQEQHSLGLLMVEALLALEGCTCVSLGTQTPLTDIAQAALAHRADVVALSFSNLHKAAVVQTSLRELRAQLPATTALWVGGACTALHQWPLPGISAVQHLSGLHPCGAVAPRPLTEGRIGHAHHCTHVAAHAHPLSRRQRWAAAGPAGGRHWPAAGRLRQHAPAARRHGRHPF
jgi:hypothetical protein